MKTIFRNLFYTLRRFRLAFFLNLLGLSTAFAAFILIMMRVSYECNFDTCYPQPEQLVILNMEEEGSHTITALPRGVIDYLIEQVPGIEYGSIYAPCWEQMTFYTHPQDPHFFNELPWGVYPDFGKIVGLEFVEGSDEEMNQQECVLISESYACKLFPEGNALGAYLYVAGEQRFSPGVNKYRVCGVFKDLPENSQFHHDIFISMGNRQQGDWGSQNYFAFFRLKKGVNVTEVNRQIEATKAVERLKQALNTQLKLYVMPLQEVYYEMETSLFFKTGSRSVTFLLLSIGVLILVVAGINLVNFTTALAPLRMRSINTQKVLGSSDRELRRGLILESLGMVLMGWLGALGLVILLTRWNMLSFMGFTPSLFMYREYVLYTAFMACGLGWIAGLYPAWYMTSFSPALVLKGNYALGSNGKRMRMCLIAFQYVVSFILMASAGFMFLQNRLMRVYDLGLDKDRIVVASLPRISCLSSLYQKFEGELKACAEIEDIAYANWKLGSSEGYSQYVFHYRGEGFGHNYIDVTPNFCKVMGLELLSGNDFLPSDSITRTPLKFIATQDLEEKSGIQPGEVIDFTPWGMRAIVKGYVNKVRFTSLKSAPVPYVFCVNGRFADKILPFAYIRVTEGSDREKVLQHIRTVMEATFTGYPVEVQSYETMYAQLYRQEFDQQQMVTWCSILAVLISLVGVFGLVVFEAEHRRKEIGIRKVYGASTGQIIWLFGRNYLILSVACSMGAIPIVVCIMSEWLMRFSERIPLYPWVFVVACGVMGLITLLIVIIQNYRAAVTNPVDSLKTE